MGPTTIEASLHAIPWMAQAQGWALTWEEHQRIVRHARSRVRSCGLRLRDPTPPNPWWMKKWREIAYDALRAPELPPGPRRILIEPVHLAVLLGTEPPASSLLTSPLSCAAPPRKAAGRKPPSPAPLA